MKKFCEISMGKNEFYLLTWQQIMLFYAPLLRVNGAARYRYTSYIVAIDNFDGILRSICYMMVVFAFDVQLSGNLT